MLKDCIVNSAAGLERCKQHRVGRAEPVQALLTNVIANHVLLEIAAAAKTAHNLFVAKQSDVAVSQLLAPGASRSNVADKRRQAHRHIPT